MPRIISNDAIVTKNQLSSTCSWLTFLEISYPGEDTVFLCDNNEITYWRDEQWLPFVFSVGNIKEERDGENQIVQLAISDPARLFSPILDIYDGGIGATIIIRVALSDHLDDNVYESEYFFTIISANIDWRNTIVFNLGSENFINSRFPQERFLKNTCQWKIFKGTGCLPPSGPPSPQYEAATSCDRQFATCLSYENSKRYRGFPQIGGRGILT